jgi:hypothetical protein
VKTKDPIYNVIVDQQGVRLEKLAPGSAKYRKASKQAILRQRDAIERVQKLKAEGGRLEGVHSFQFLDTARTFAMLTLRLMQLGIEDNLDRVQSYGIAES